MDKILYNPMFHGVVAAAIVYYGLKMTYYDADKEAEIMESNGETMSDEEPMFTVVQIGGESGPTFDPRLLAAAAGVAVWYVSKSRGWISRETIFRSETMKPSRPGFASQFNSCSLDSDYLSF